MPGDGRDWSLALSVVTAWRERSTLGLDEVTKIAEAAAAETAGGWPQLALTIASLAVGFLDGFDKATADLLADPARMSRAFVACAKQEPLSSSDVGLDAAAVLDRIGRAVASLPT